MLGTINAMRGLLIVRLLGFKNIGDKLLRVTIDDRKPGALHLDHDAVAPLEDVVRGVQVDRKRRDGAGDKWFRRFERIAEASTEYVVGNHQLIAG